MSNQQKGSNEALPYTCIRCGRRYKWKCSLKSHLINECGQEPQFQCQYCPLRCKVKSSLLRHIRNVHVGKQ
ncbi:hypothetical protein C0J52_26516 [Blattella germanica]|nr:hypothetical protein C0J52_26516 [Blattella germanica]